MKLLIAEDNAFFRNLLQQVLSPEHELLFANDGDEAWALLQSPDSPRLAILDWVMPGLTGPQLCRNIRACPELSSMYLILFTARNSAADITSGLRAGADAYITKPFDPEQLRARVRFGQNILHGQDAAETHSILVGHTLRHENRVVEDVSAWPFYLEQSAEANSYAIGDCVLGPFAPQNLLSPKSELTTSPCAIPRHWEKLHA